MSVQPDSEVTATTTPTNDAAYTVMKCSALSYAETSSALGIPLDGSVPFSVDGWVKLNGLCSSASILSKENAFQFGIVGDMLVFAIDGYPPVRSDARRQPLDDVTWHYVCATYDGGNVRLYIDGRFNVLQAISGSGASNANPFRVGADLQALVWKVRVYNEALSADAVKTNQFGAPAVGTIVADFDFSQNPPVDHGPGHHPITLSGAEMLTYTPSLAVTSTGFAQPLREEHVNPGGHQVDPYTVQSWVYIESVSQPVQTVFVNSDLESDTGMALNLVYDDQAQGFHVVSQRGSDVTGDALTSTGVVQPGRWTNVATTFDGTTLSIYLDGVLDTSHPARPIPLAHNEGNVIIGASLRAGIPAGATGLQGYVSRLEVWKTALSASDVLTYAANPPAIDATGLVAAYDLTTSPAANRLDGHPIGLAGGAALVSQVTPAVSGATSELATAPAGGEPLAAATVKALVATVDLAAFLDDHHSDLMAARAADAAVFAEDSDERHTIEAAWDDVLDRMRDGPLTLPFLVTAHVVDGERLLLCHQEGRTRVVYRAPEAEIDDCTMWKIRLLFVVIAGVLDALFGLTSSLTDTAIGMIGRAIANPRIGVILAVGTAVSATTIFDLVNALYREGFLRELAKAVITVGFWTALRVLAKIVLTFMGVGAADVIASLVATAATFAVTYSQRPASCEPLPTVTLAEIRFDYDPTRHSVDALTIRHNASSGVPVPEWVPGRTDPASSPAAYSIRSVSGKTITIQGSFLVTGAGSTAVEIKADGGGVLGAIDPFTVTLAGGTSSPTPVTIQLPHHQLATGGVQRQDVTWSWSYRVGSGSWVPLATTAHRVYALLQTPTGPWVQSSIRTNTQLPWTDVLDIACAWAAGMTTPEEVAAAVTEHVNGSVGLVYDNAGGASKYTTPSFTDWQFLCTDFLAYLAGTGGNGNVVNCTDCATIVTTFANSVGASVFGSRMYGVSAGRQVGFKTNKIIAIGGKDWGYPFPNSPSQGVFSYHEVAWVGSCNYTSKLFDACLKVDSSGNPWDWSPGASHSPELATNMAFTTKGIAPSLPIATPFTDSSYRERLATNTADGIGHCIPQSPFPGTESGRRRVR